MKVDSVLNAPQRAISNELDREKAETHDLRELQNRLAMQGGRNIVLTPHAYGGEGSETSPRTAAGKLAVAAGNASREHGEST